eukprot:m.53795 g.53795  ORF g.53795 m.53795 type:complete len:73 (+) comp13584_c0_seq1:414-632(+)
MSGRTFDVEMARPNIMYLFTCQLVLRMRLRFRKGTWYEASFSFGHPGNGTNTNVTLSTAPNANAKSPIASAA